MSRFLRVIGSWSLSLSLVLAPAVVSKASANPTESRIPEQVTQIAGYPFPKQVAGLSRMGKTDYNNPGLGFSIGYAKQSEAWADIYVYDLGKDLTAASQAAEVKDQLRMALGDTAYAVSAGAYEDAKVIAKAETDVFAKAHLTITQKRKTRHSYVFITVRGKNFVKIRFTASTSENPDQLADRFIAEYTRLLGK